MANREALRTLMIMYSGEYSGILTPYHHYVPLEKDHSNMEEVVAIFRDTGRCEEIIQAAYSEIARNPELTFRAFVERFDKELTVCWETKRVPIATPYTASELRIDSKPDPATRYRRWRRRLLVVMDRLLFESILRFMSQENKDRIRIVAKSNLAWLKGRLSSSDLT